MPTCWHCKAESAAAHYQRVVHNKTPLYGPWAGWRMAGRLLVSPDRDRITAERLRGILWAEAARGYRTKSGLQEVGNGCQVIAMTGHTPESDAPMGTRSKATP